MISKKLGQRAHSKRRAWERFGLKFNRDNLKEIVHLVQTQHGIHIQRASNSRSMWAIKYKGQKLYVAYDKNTKTIATIMPLEYAVCDILKDVYKSLDYLDYDATYIFRDDILNLNNKVTLAYDLFKEVIK